MSRYRAKWRSYSETGLGSSSNDFNGSLELPLNKDTVALILNSEHPLAIGSLNNQHVSIDLFSLKSF